MHLHPTEGANSTPQPLSWWWEDSLPLPTAPFPLLAFGLKFWPFGLMNAPSRRQIPGYIHGFHEQLKLLQRVLRKGWKNTAIRLDLIQWSHTEITPHHLIMITGGTEKVANCFTFLMLSSLESDSLLHHITTIHSFILTSADSLSCHYCHSCVIRHLLLHSSNKLTSEWASSFLTAHQHTKGYSATKNVEWYTIVSYKNRCLWQNQ